MFTNFSLPIFIFTQNGKNIHNFSNLYTGWMNHESKLKNSLANYRIELNDIIY